MPIHNHEMAPDLFPTTDSAKRAIKVIEPSEGQIKVRYQRAGKGQRPAYAIVIAENETSALVQICKIWPETRLIKRKDETKVL